MEHLIEYFIVTVAQVLNEQFVATTINTLTIYIHFDSHTKSYVGLVQIILSIYGCHLKYHMKDHLPFEYQLTQGLS